MTIHIKRWLKKAPPGPGDLQRSWHHRGRSLEELRGTWSDASASWGSYPTVIMGSKFCGYFPNSVAIPPISPWLLPPISIDFSYFTIFQPFQLGILWLKYMEIWGVIIMEKYEPWFMGTWDVKSTACSDNWWQIIGCFEGKCMINGMYMEKKISWT